MNVIGNKSYGSPQAALSHCDTRDWARLLKNLGVALEDLTKNTYVYINDDGQIIACNKSDTRSKPADEYKMIGYVVAFEDGRNLKAIKAKMG